MRPRGDITLYVFSLSLSLTINMYQSQQFILLMSRWPQRFLMYSLFMVMMLMKRHTYSITDDHKIMREREIIKNQWKNVRHMRLGSVNAKLTMAFSPFFFFSIFTFFFYFWGRRRSLEKKKFVEYPARDNNVSTWSIPNFHLIPKPAANRRTPKLGLRGGVGYLSSCRFGFYLQQPHHLH